MIRFNDHVPVIVCGSRDGQPYGEVDAEIWRPVPGDAWREVSNHGRLRTWRPMGGTRVKRMSHPVVLSNKPSIDGYVRVSFGAGRHRYLHRLVLEAFAGPCPQGMEACHNNGIRSDNRWPTNLRWDTPKRNHMDKLRHGTQRRGERQGNAKLTADAVATIRASRTSKDLAGLFGVTTKTIKSVRRRATWRHLP